MHSFVRFDALLVSICVSFSLLGPVVDAAAEAAAVLPAAAATAAAVFALITAAVRFEPDDGSADNDAAVLEAAGPVAG